MLRCQRARPSSSTTPATFATYTFADSALGWRSARAKSPSLVKSKVPLV
jgi:hypothetical protein